jgi:hypothetical protein
MEEPASGSAAVVFGEATATSKVDVTVLHAKIGELTLENDFLEKALTKAGLLSAKPGSPSRVLCVNGVKKDDRSRAQITDQQEDKDSSDQPQQRVLPASSGLGSGSVADAPHRRVASELSVCE